MHRTRYDGLSPPTQAGDRRRETSTRKEFVENAIVCIRRRHWPWRIVRNETIVGEPLIEAKRLNVVSASEVPPETDAPWVLRGITNNERYVVRSEKSEIVAKQQGLARPEATCAALIPIRKNAAWWEHTQDERRSVFEEQSKHIQIGLVYLPAVARRLHHCRDLSENEPFDFLNWFEYAPIHEVEFNKLLSELRASEEWKYVEREVDIGLRREDV